MNTGQPDSKILVEHFFRHEHANLVSLLTRSFGFSKIDLIEDMVGAAMLQAMNTWKQNRLPDNPTAWIHRVARNRMIDHIRREKAHAKAVESPELRRGQDAGVFDNNENDLDEHSLSDSLLRMMFVCCHPSLDRKSQIALTLKLLCGFSVAEISRGLLMTAEATKKRIQRAKAQLAAENVAIEFPPAQQLPARLSVVHDVLYLMFNEGYSTSHGVEPIRDDVCEEAARLCHLLCEHESFSTSESRALLALMLFHASRLEARTDSLGNIVLLEDQDRSQWDRRLIEIGSYWLAKSADERASQPSKFHFEALIAQYHCQSTSLDATDWPKIIQLYGHLISLYPSPVYRLNRAIARGQNGEYDLAIQEIQELKQSHELNDYFLLDCAAGHVHALAGNEDDATDAFLAALAGDVAPHQKAVIEQRLRDVTKTRS